jgi:hypothetical protein
MFKYQKFLIRPTDHFDAATFPFLEENISFAKGKLDIMPSVHRTEMLVSFLKDHCIKSEWVADNPELAELISSKVLPLTDFEALFESGKDNTAFVSELEAYIKEQFAVVLVVPHLPEEIN